MVQQSPARAEPHDVTSWLPLPEPESLPTVDELLTADPEVAPPAPRDFVAAPSPARAEPHDETTWLPLPDLAPELTRDPATDPTSEPATAPTNPPRRHGRTRRVLHGVHVPFRVALAITIAVALAGSFLYFRANIFDAGSSVHLQVDGKKISAVTGVYSVASLLREQHITLSPQDRVVPALDTHISDGMSVHVLRAFSVNVNLDGVTKAVPTTYSTPKTFLDHLDLGPQVVMVDQPTRIDSNSVVTLRTKHTGTLTVDTQTVQYDAPAATVQELLKLYAVVLGPQDFTQPAITTPLTNGTAVNLVRVATETRQAAEPYTVADQSLPDATMDVGTTRVVDGVPGLQTVTYQIIRNNGNIVAQNPISKVPTQAATPKITYYGTKADWHWDKLAECETGGNWAAPGPTWQGGIGIWYGNWAAYGGTQYAPTAGQATREQQILIGMKIQKDHGWQAWGCAYTLGWVSGTNPFR